MHKGNYTWEIRTTGKIILWVQADTCNLIDGSLMFATIDDNGTRTVIFVASPNMWISCHLVEKPYGDAINVESFVVHINVQIVVS